MIRGVLHTGAAPLYLTARIEDGRVESEATTEEAWPPDEKVIAEALGLFRFETRDRRAFQSSRIDRYQVEERFLIAGLSAAKPLGDRVGHLLSL